MEVTAKLWQASFDGPFVLLSAWQDPDDSPTVYLEFDDVPDGGWDGPAVDWRKLFLVNQSYDVGYQPNIQVVDGTHVTLRFGSGATDLNSHLVVDTFLVDGEPVLPFTGTPVLLIQGTPPWA